MTKYFKVYMHFKSLSSFRQNDSTKWLFLINKKICNKKFQCRRTERGSSTATRLLQGEGPAVKFTKILRIFLTLAL